MKRAVRFLVLLSFAGLFLSGCAFSSKKLNDHLRTEPSATENQDVKIPVAFIPQEKNLCGPTVLKMAAERFLPGVEFEIYKQMTFRENVQGTFKTDMLSSARRLGLALYKVPSLDTMLAQIDRGQPVIVFQNLGLSWLPKWHYSLLVGYNRPRNSVYLHSGTTAYERVGFDRFVKMWERGGRWSMIVVSPETVPSYASFEETLDNAIVFENLGRRDLAKQVYVAMTRVWPERFEPHLGLANIYYSEQDRRAAIRETLFAVQKKPAHPAPLVNLAILYHEDGKARMAAFMKEKALAAAPEEQREEYRRKLAF